MNKRILFLIAVFIIANKLYSLVKFSHDQETLVISVDVKGAVTNPGVYTYNKPLIVDEILNDVGLSKDADTSCMNLANEISENTVITVPTTIQCSSSSLININTATAAEISTLDGIGETRAEDIVAFRIENGSFSSITDIKLVPGIGDVTYDKIKNSITI